MRLLRTVTKCMNKDSTYLLVDTSVLPEVFSKVIEVKQILGKGKIKSINEAVKSWDKQKHFTSIKTMFSFMRFQG